MVLKPIATRASPSTIIVTTAGAAAESRQFASDPDQCLNVDY